MTTESVNTPRAHKTFEQHLKSILHRHGSARQAFVDGDFPSALMMSHYEDNPELLACCLVMCGAIELGLSKLNNMDANSDEALICKSYALWLENDKKGVVKNLALIKNKMWNDRAKAISSKISQQHFNVLILSSTPIKDIPIINEQQENINIYSLVVDDNSWTIPVTKLLPEKFKPDIILSLSIYGKYLPAGVFELQAKTIFHVGDPDIGLAAQYNDLSQAHMIICGSIGEREMFSGLYPARVVAFPCYTPNHNTTPVEFGKKQKHVDVAFTGSLFRPHRNDNARLAYHLATVDDPLLDIRIHDGHLETKIYQSLLGKTKLTLSNNRFIGGYSTRIIDAIRNGTKVLVSEHQPIHYMTSLLFKETVCMVENFSENNLLENLKKHLSENASFNNTLKRNAQVIGNQIQNCFPNSPEREIRLAKFAIAQSIFLRASETEKIRERTVKLYRPIDWLFIPVREQNPIESFSKINTIANHSRIDLVILANAVFEYFSSSKNSDKHFSFPKKVFDLAVNRFPESIALRFNRGRVNWLLGKKSDAIEDLNWLDQSIQGGQLDLARERLLSHRIRLLARFMPYGVYHQTVAKDLQSEDYYGTQTRFVILATVRVYLAVNSFQYGNFDKGINYLRSALNLCPQHFPAAHTLTKALWKCNHGEFLHWFYQTIEMYPPYLTELLPFGVDAEERSDNDDRAFNIVKNWAYFVARVQFSDPSSLFIPTQTFKAVRPYLDRLHPNIRQQLNKKIEMQKHLY